MLKKSNFIFISIILTSLSFAFQASADEVSPKSLFETEVPKNDQSFAHNFFQFYRSIKKRINIKSAKTAVKLLNKDSVFYDYKPTLKASIKLLRAKPGSFEFYYGCEENLKRKKYKILNKLSNKIKWYCEQKFFQALGKRKARTYSLTEKNFIKNNLASILSPKNKYKFMKIIPEMKDDSANFSYISELISDYYLEKDKKIEEKLLAHLNLNPKVSKYVQEKGVYSYFHRRLFKRQFYKYVNAFNRHFRALQIDNAIRNARLALNFYKNNKKFINARKAWINITLSGKRLISSNKKNEAMFLLNEAYDIAPKDDKETAIFNIFWAHLVFEDYTKSLAIIDNYNLFKRFDSLSPKMKYWISFAVKKTGDKNLLKHLLQKVIDGHPDDFYSIMASKDLVETFPEISSTSLTSKYRQPASSSINIKGELTAKSQKIVIRMMAWLNLGLDSFVRSEVKALKKLASKDLIKDHSLTKDLNPGEYLNLINYNLITLFNNKNQFLYSFRILHEGLSNGHMKMNKETLTHLFPPRFFDKIKKNAINQGLDPLLVISLIRQESAFNPRARSHVGARGLMQLMPATAKQVQRRVRTSRLNHPDTNLKIGTKYLKGLLKNYNGNMVHSLAAYNAGPGNVRKWRKELFVKDDPLFMIESIPFDETRKYVKLIYRNLYFYNLLLEDKHLHQPINVSFHTSI